MIKKKIFLCMLFLIFINSIILADTYPSPKRWATSDFSDDMYDTYDYITTRPDMLVKIDGTQLIIFPDELAHDILSLINMINDNPECAFYNRIGFGYGNGKFGLGVHFRNLYDKHYSSSPYYNQNSDITDSDNDGIYLEANELQTTIISASTNFYGKENLDFGGGMGFSFGKLLMGIGYQGFIDDNHVIDNIDYYESFENYYGSSILNNKTNYIYKQQSKDKDHQNHIIFNIGINRMESSNKNNFEAPLFLLETRLIIFEEHDINRYEYTRTEDSDPSGNISSSLFNKKVYNGYNVSSKPTKELDEIREGLKLQFKPKFNFQKSDQLEYNVQGKFGIGLNIKDSNDEKTVYSYTDYRTDIPALYQDTVSSYEETIADYQGDGKYLMYGLRLEQVFKPKYFTIGIAVDATVEQNTIQLSGTTIKTIREKYDSTYTNYILISPVYPGVDKKYIDTQYPDYEKGTIETKNIKTTISIPVGFEFNLAKYIKLRTGYTYKVVHYYIKTTSNTTNNYAYVKTTTYEDPSKKDEVDYGSDADYSENNSTLISTDTDISHIFTAGCEIILSEKTSFNLGGHYDVIDRFALIILDTKLKF